MERNDIVACRNHTQGYIWQNPENTEGLKVPIGKCARLIVCHAGSPSFRFANNSKLIFRCKSGSTEDYHWQMNADIFEKWFVEMLANLEVSSVVRKKYKHDEIAVQMGHEVVILPPYHCQYNPIELSWAQVKGEVAKKNSTFKMTELKCCSTDEDENDDDELPYNFNYDDNFVAPEDTITLKVLGYDNTFIMFKMRKNTPFKKLMKSYCERT
ncbi:DDE 3 domain-containing protein, partial [Aphis craccivora]